MAKEKDENEEVTSFGEAAEIFVNEYAEKMTDIETWKAGAKNAASRILGEEAAEIIRKRDS